LVAFMWTSPQQGFFSLKVEIPSPLGVVVSNTQYFSYTWETNSISYFLLGICTSGKNPLLGSLIPVY
jgi:hypothetical protein